MEERRGYTTGTWAAAAARGAAMALFLGEEPVEVEVSLPQGGSAVLPLERVVKKGRSASCTVIKRGVERGDATSGLRLVATVFPSPGRGVRISGGRGVGRVTKPGLEVAEGERAINPLPRAMILREVEKVLQLAGEGRGCQVVISAPGGEKVAARTLNPRLGILGGISILGTTGIMIPYSTHAYLAALKKSLEVARACGNLSVALCTGRRSEALAMRSLELPEECFVNCGDRFYFALRRSAILGFRLISVWAMPGKMAKLASGKLDLHSRHGLPDLDFLRAITGVDAAPPDLPREIRDAASVKAFFSALDPRTRERSYRRLCELAAGHCRSYVGGDISVQCNLVTQEGELGATCCAPASVERGNTFRAVGPGGPWRDGGRDGDGEG